MRNRAGLETQARVVRATRRLLAERGLEGTTVKAICDCAGIRAGSFYNLFETKEQAILTVVREAITAVDPDPTGREDSLSELVEAYLHFVVGQKELARVYFLIALSGGITDPSIRHRALRHHQERLRRFTAAYTRQNPDVDAGDAYSQMEATVAAINGFALQYLIDPTFDLETHARNLIASVPVG